MQINHINIKAGRVAIVAEKGFLQQILGLQEGKRPDASSQGYWLCNINNQPLIHLSINESKTIVGEVIDHIAFAVVDIAPYKLRLTLADIAYTTHYIDSLRTEQIFFYTPLGIKIELNTTTVTL